MINSMVLGHTCLVSFIRKSANCPLEKAAWPEQMKKSIKITSNFEELRSPTKQAQVQEFSSGAGGGGEGVPTFRTFWQAK